MEYDDLHNHNHSLSLVIVTYQTHHFKCREEPPNYLKQGILGKCGIFLLAHCGIGCTYLTYTAALHFTLNNYLTKL